MSDDERGTEGIEVEAHGKRWPRSDAAARDQSSEAEEQAAKRNLRDGESSEESEVEEQGYRFPGEDGRVRHPATSDSEVSER